MQQLLRNKVNQAIFIALLFHVSGAIGMLVGPYKAWFVSHTPLNLLLMATLLLYTEPKLTKGCLLFSFLAFSTGFITEIIGVNTGLLFGVYSYGSVMGIKLWGVPLLIGVQWMVTVFCCAQVTKQLHNWMTQKAMENGTILPTWLHQFAWMIDAALLATLFDYLIEPVAIQLHFWHWTKGSIPLYNYVCWFIISLLLMFVYKKLYPNQQNQFAKHLFIIQVLFFTALRCFL